jgi:hypothetical protein
LSSTELLKSFKSLKSKSFATMPLEKKIVLPERAHHRVRRAVPVGDAASFPTGSILPA